MKALLNGRTAALLLIAGATPATAADADQFGYGGGQVSTGGPAYEATAPIAGPWDWTGPYVGVTGGYGWGKMRKDDVTGAIGGATAGMNVQTGAVVLGAETDFSFSGMEGQRRARRSEIDWVGTVRGRIGYAFDRFVAYGTGGLAYGSANISSGRKDDWQTQVGWTVGLGLEAKITGGLSAKVEYLYVDLGREKYRLAGPVPVDVSANMFRVGLNYQF
jgi:outer membrane immunogenic protein